jgi:L-erythro-3,5-diaminohexanoate dehydrogenase
MATKGLGDKYGYHRVLEPKGVLPQTAWKIDNTMDIWDNEILVDVTTLNIDSASFTQIKNQAENDEEKIAQIILNTVNTRGKQHNPVTNSGGMFVGKVKKIGKALEGKLDIRQGDKIASLVSLSLTPLKIYSIKKVHLHTQQVDIEGEAVLFESGIWGKIPENIPEKVALAVLDVAGAAPQVAKLVNPGDLVAIFGATGKSGLLCCYEAKKRAGINGKVIGIDLSQIGLKKIENLGFCDLLIKANAQNPLELYNLFVEQTDGKLADVSFNMVNVENTEMSSILCTKDGGKIYFFSMSTSFTKAALGAEAVAKDVDMIIGNGYTKGHANFTLSLLQESEKLRELFTQLYG